MARTTPINTGYTIINGSTTGPNGSKVNTWIEYLVSKVQGTSRVTVHAILYSQATVSSSTKYSASEEYGWLSINNGTQRKLKISGYNFENYALNKFAEYTFDVDTNQYTEITLRGEWKTTHSSWITGGNVSGLVELVFEPSTINAVTSTFGSNTALTINRASESYKHNIFYTFGSKIKQPIASNISASQLNWNIPESLVTEISGVRGTGSIIIETYNSAGGLVGETSAVLTLAIPNSKVNPITARLGAETQLIAINSITSVALTYKWSYAAGSYSEQISTNSKTYTYTFPKGIEIDGTSLNTTISLATYRGTTLVGTTSAVLALYPPIASSSNGEATTGTTCIIPIHKNKNNLSVVIKAKLGTFEETIAYLGTTAPLETSVNWIPAVSRYAPLMPTSDTVNVTISLDSYNGVLSEENYLGTLEYTYVLTLDESVKGTSELILSPINDNEIVDAWNIYLQGYTKLRATLSAEARYSTIVGGYISGKNINVYSDTLPINQLTGIIGEAGTYTYNGYAVDGRGRRTSESAKTITVHQYFKPSVANVSITRCDETGHITDNGDHVLPTFQENFASCDDHNQIICTLQFKQTNESTWTDGQIVTSGTPISGFDKQKSYDVRIKVTDLLTPDASAYYSATFKIPISTRVLNINKNGKAMAIGGFTPDNAENKLDIFWQTDFKQNPTVNGQPIGGGSLGVKIQRGSDAITSSLKTITFDEEFTSVPTVVASYASTGTLASGDWASIKISSITTKGFKIAYGGSGTASYPIDFIAIGV